MLISEQEEANAFSRPVNRRGRDFLPDPGSSGSLRRAGRPTQPTMILNLLLLLLPVPVFLGEVELQRHSVAQEELNHTASVATDHRTVVKMNNASLGSYDNWTSLMDDELQNNQTFGFVTEDEEGFQDQEDQFPWQRCQRHLLLYYSQFCKHAFQADMLALHNADRCVLDNIIRAYHHLTLCVEETSHWVGCSYPNNDVQDLFLHVHAVYFQGCSGYEPVQDAPYGLVVALTLTPISLIPVLVYMVVCKSKTTP